MTISDLKQYVAINRKWLSPSEQDCSDPAKYQKVKNDIPEIMQADKLAYSFSAEYNKRMFAYWEISLAFYILACLPFLIFLLPLNGGELIIYQTPEYKITIGGFGWILYILTFVALIINSKWRDISDRNTFAVSTVLRYVVLVLCAFFGGIRNVTIFGSEYSWFFIALFGGFVITLAARFIDCGRVTGRSKKYDETVMKLNATAVRIKESSNEFTQLGDRRYAELKQLFPTIEISPRMPWYDFQRRYNGKNIMQFPACRRAETDFSAPFTESSITTNRSDSKRDIEVTVDVTIYSQDFGYRDITAQEAQSILSSGRIYPFFYLGLPAFIDGLEYKLFRHKWHYVKTTSSKGVLHKSREVDSQAQKDFDNYKAMKEYELYKKYGKSMEELRKEMPETVYYYEEEMAKKRERIGSSTEYYDESVDRSGSVESKGDEIGVLTVRTPAGELLGLYCGDSVQSIHFAEKIAAEETDFTYDPLMSYNGETQRAFLYNKFSK